MNTNPRECLRPFTTALSRAFSVPPAIRPFPNSQPRRTRADSHGSLWGRRYHKGTLGVFGSASAVAFRRQLHRCTAGYPTVTSIRAALGDSLPQTVARSGRGTFRREPMDSCEVHDRSPLAEKGSYAPGPFPPRSRV